MRKITVILIFLILFSSYLTCKDLKLTEKEAMDLIRKEMRFPIPMAIEIVFNPEINNGLCLEFIRLINEGYLEVAEYELNCLRRGQLKNEARKSGLLRGADFLFTQPRITKKGQNLLQYASFENGKGKIHFSSYTLMYDIKKIKEILLDKDNNLALVTYMCGYTPTDYFHKLRDIDKDLIEKTFKNYLGIEKEHEITFKKWDKRWRVQ